ncbi:hypothetical protein CR513_07454, partial [Mucuna pruriens]
MLLKKSLDTQAQKIVSCVTLYPSMEDTDTNTPNQCELYVDKEAPHLIAIGDADARVLVPIDEVQMVGQALNTFIA